MSFYIKSILVNARNCYRRFVDTNRSNMRKLQMCGTEEEMREVAGRICRNYLHGAWKTVDPSELDFKRISGGLSNFLYYVALPDTSKIRYTRESSLEADEARLQRRQIMSSHSFSMDEPKKVLLRIYGQVHGERAMDAIVTESVIFTLLSERRLGPKLHGVFSGGRIEQYVPARSLLTKELSEPSLSMKIAEKMAAIHSMDVPLSKEPNWLWKTIYKWSKIVKEERLDNTVVGKNDQEQSIIKHLRTIDFDKEIEWLKKFLATVESPVVFCHNDMQEGNILMLEDDTPNEEESTAYVGSYEDKKDIHYDDEDSIISQISDSGEPKLVLIDFEYCAYNYRGFDIANHFQEWCYDYTNPETPFYHENHDNAATLEQKEIFIKEYLKHYHSAEDRSPSIDDVNQLLAEVEAFALASDLFWSLWSIVNASKSQIPFGYWEYGLSRVESYLRLKQEVIKKANYGLPLKRKICEVDI
nr:choline/ethanolamine kinase isoform X1 [Danaus plexippus plexippus]